ncbi:MAG: 30S ribosomal protein S1 [Gammaproteobacteria bacterium]
MIETLETAPQSEPLPHVEPAVDLDSIEVNDLDALLEANLGALKFKSGSLISGIVTEIGDEDVCVYVGLKSEGRIAKNEFFNEQGELNVQEGDEVEVALELVEDGRGSPVLSRENARILSVWAELTHAYDTKTSVTGYIRGKVKGGFSVEIGTVRAFMPGSLLDIQNLHDITHLENQPLEMRIIKLDRERNNVVVSRRAVLLEELHKNKDSLLAQLAKDQVHEGMVKNLTPYGAFVDLGGVDGLLHNTDISWQRIRDPSEVLSIGDKIQVKVLDFDPEKLRISLGLKQLTTDPWDMIGSSYPLQTKHQGKVTGVREYGCFVSLGEGIEGLVHASEIDWSNQHIIPAERFSVGDEVEVMVLEVDYSRRRISLGMKQCIVNPWDTFKEKFPPGSKVDGVVCDLTDFGIFIDLEGGVTGLVHLSEISWNQDGKQAMSEFSKDQKLETRVLSVDTNRQRISLGIKQLEVNPLDPFVAQHSKGDLIEVEVTEVDADQVTVCLSEQLYSTMRKNNVTTEAAVSDLRDVVKQGSKIQVRIQDIDFSKGRVKVSAVAAEKADHRIAMKEHSQQMQRENKITLGDALDAGDKSN